MKDNIYSELKGLDLIAHIGSNLGVAGTAQGHCMYFDVKVARYITKELQSMNDIQVELTDMSNPIVNFTESLDYYVVEEDYQKILNIMGYCAYHSIQFNLNDRPTILQ